MAIWAIYFHWAFCNFALINYPLIHFFHRRMCLISKLVKLAPTSTKRVNLPGENCALQSGNERDLFLQTNLG